MMNRLPSVFDTNSATSALLISTLISRHAFGKTLDHYQILVSDETVAEFDDVTGREKFETCIKAGEREAFEELLHREAMFVEVEQTVEASRDPDDDKFLAVALDGKAEVIVSGEQDLLVLDPSRCVRIVKPRVLVEEFPPVGEAL